MKKRVFVVQKQMRWNDKTGELEPKFNLAPAEKFGEIHYLLSPTAGPFNPTSIIRELKEKLADFGPEDHLLLIGNPCLIGWAVALASVKALGKLRLLQWSGKDQAYLSIQSDLSWKV